MEYKDKCIGTACGLSSTANEAQERSMHNYIAIIKHFQRHLFDEEKFY